MSLKLYSMMWAKDMPTDIGIPRAALITPANYNWASWDVDALRKLVGDAKLVSVNFEGDVFAAMSPGWSPQQNRQAAFHIGQRLAWVRASLPGVEVDWNTSPVTLDFDAFRWGQTPQVYEDYAVCNEAIREFCLPHVDSVSVQCYFNKRPGERALWRQWTARAIWAITPWGKKLRLMVNPGYEWQSNNPASERGHWISGEDLDGLLFDLNALALDVILWGPIVPKTIPYAENLPLPYPWSVVSAEPEWARWLAMRKP